MEEKKPYVIDINGNQVFSADFVFQQMQAQSCRIDRSRHIAEFSAVVAIVAIVIAVLAFT